MHEVSVRLFINMKKGTFFWELIREIEEGVKIEDIMGKTRPPTKEKSNIPMGIIAAIMKDYEEVYFEACTSGHGVVETSILFRNGVVKDISIIYA